MKNAQCKRCLQKFNEKDIYTIQQFQYRKTPSYQWTVKFFLEQNIGEWDSFCEKCILHYGHVSAEQYDKANP